MLKGSDQVFIMTKSEKGSDYELSNVTSESSNDNMRNALEKIKDKIKL
jgi:hypothetical protein